MNLLVPVSNCPLNWVKPVYLQLMKKKKVFKPKAWEICVFIPSLFGRFILYECPPIFSSVNEMKWETLLVASYSSSKQLDWIIIINKHFKPQLYLCNCVIWSGGHACFKIACKKHVLICPQKCFVMGCSVTSDMSSLGGGPCVLEKVCSVVIGKLVP